MTKEELFRIVREAGHRILEKIAEASARGDNEEVERLSESLKRIIDALVGELKEEEEGREEGEDDWGNPVQKAIWTLRLIKSPGLWETLREIFLGETPFERERRKELKEKREYYEKMKEKMEWYLYQFTNIVSSLYQKFVELDRLLMRAKTKDGKPLPDREMNEVERRMRAVGVLESALKSGRQLNPEFIMNLHRDSVRTILDIHGLNQLSSRILDLLGVGNPLWSEVYRVTEELTRLSWDFDEMLRSMRQVGFRPISISPEEVE